MSLAEQPSVAAGLVADWCHDETLRPYLARIYEGLTGPSLREPDLSAVRARLEHALMTGELVLLREVLFKQRREGRPPPPPPVRKAPSPRVARVVREKSFLDVTVVDGAGKPLAGRRYKLQVPDGRTEVRAFEGTAQIYRRDLEPGTALLTLLPGEGDPVPVDDLVPDDPIHFVSFHVVDQDGDPLGGVRYELTLADGTLMTGATDDSGAVFASDVQPGTCALSLPDLADDAWDLGGT